MTDRFARFRNATADALLRGNGTTAADLRHAVARGTPPPDLVPLVEKIRRHAYKVTDADLDALRARYTEDQIFEIVTSAAFGAAEARLAAGRKALEDA